MSRKRTALVGLLAVVSAAFTAPTAVAESAALDWRDCGNGTQCAVLTVPVDWRRPSGPATTIDVARLPARDPGQRLGALIANFGGPGNSTFALTNGRPPAIDRLADRFDVVVFDPRGLGRTPDSTQVRCAKPPADIHGLVLATDQGGWNRHAEQNAGYAASCRDASGPAFNGLTSWQIAHDLDALRTALGEPRLRYFGNSYGTVYAQAYAELFPKRVERMYLDGVADHTQPTLEPWLRNYALTQEQQLIRFRDWCAERQGCLLHGSDAAAVWDDLVARARRAPLPAPSAGATVTVNQLFAGALVGMTPPRWPSLAQAMAKARDGDAGEFLTKLQYPPGEPFGTVSRASLCHDFMPVQPGYQQFLAMERRLKAIAPRFGWIEGRYEVGRCLGVPGEPAYPPHPLRAKGLPPVLVGIGELDNNTNNLGAAHVAAQLPGARALWHGDGHAAFMLGNKCLGQHVRQYLADGTLPPAGTRCPGELVQQIPDRPVEDGQGSR